MCFDCVLQACLTPAAYRRQRRNGLSESIDDQLPEVTPEMHALAEKIRAWYAQPGHATGSVLHVTLDDYNLADDELHPIWYEDMDDEHRGPLHTVEPEHARTPERERAAHEICEGLRALTVSQRHVTVYVAHTEGWSPHDRA